MNRPDSLAAHYSQLSGSGGNPPLGSGLPEKQDMDLHWEGVTIGIDQVFQVAEEQVAGLICDHPLAIPVHTDHGRWAFDGDAWAPSWTGGFLTGMMWIFAERTGQQWWYDQAKRYSRLIEPRKFDKGTHDIGFLFTPSWGRWHRLFPSDETAGVLVEAGKTMAGRFNPSGRYLRTWVDRGSSFIDIMMNLDIIYQAAEISGETHLADIATAHALTSRRYLVRGDSSTIHEGWFDPSTGEFLRAATHQGYRSDSSWVRGHSWALYGFGSAYRWTSDERFLDTAKRCADYYLERTGDRLIACNDWDDPSPRIEYEASSASIAAAGMLQLADLLGSAGTRYRQYAARIIGRLSSPEFLGLRSDGWEGIIKHCTYHERNELGVDESVMWGDYYFVEALQRLESADSEVSKG